MSEVNHVVQVPQPHAQELHQMLSAEPGVTFEQAGWAVVTFTVSGPADVIEALVPRLRDWQTDCESRDAW